MGQDQFDEIETYFSALNPIANKIHEDIRTAKSTYKPVWHELNHHEQCDLINKSLIKPEITIRYFERFSPSISAVSTSSSALSNELRAGENEDSERLLDLDKTCPSDKIYMFDGQNLATYSRQKTAQKWIHDDVVGVFRDEHSGPFSVKTKSQLNLSLFPNTQREELRGSAKMFSSIINANSKSSTATTTSIAQKQTTKNMKTKEGTSAGPKSLFSKYSIPKSSRNKYEHFNKDQKMSADDGTFTEVCIDRFAELALNDSKDNLVFSISSDDHHSHASIGSYERKGLMASTDSEQQDCMSSLHSGEDDDKHAYEDESRLLLNTSSFDIRKGFEFLSNW